MRASQFRERVDILLQQGLRELSMTLGVLAHIENDHYEIVAVQSNSGAYVSGEKYDLGNSFSRKVLEQQRTIAATEIENNTHCLHHPLYRSLPLECYLGAPITVGGHAWGCVDFSSMAQRDEPFTEQDQKLIESLAAEISQLIEHAARTSA